MPVIAMIAAPSTDEDSGAVPRSADMPRHPTDG
jgi:hypothetical protein